MDKIGPSNTLLYITKTGSHLYGTNHKDSDTDYKGIYVPCIYDLILKKDLEEYEVYKQTSNKNTKEDIDFELWSIHKFLKLLSKGDTGALDLLFSMFSEDTIVYKNKNIVELFKNNYEIFVTSQTKAFTGYCVAQARKYGVKGTRYAELKKFMDLEYMDGIDPEDKLKQHMYDWDLSLFEYANIVSGEGANRSELMYLEILNRKFSETITIREFTDRLENIEKQYGDRSKAASEGTDWKAISHAVRVIGQVKELLQHKKITFPLINAEQIKNIKFGKVPLSNVRIIVEEGLNEIDELVKVTDLPDKVNPYKVDLLLLKLISEL
jgi:predicted nucleotidyltransferase